MKILHPIPSDRAMQLGAHYEDSYLREIDKFLYDEITQGKHIGPPVSDIFLALKLCGYQNTKVVILGQDPYPSPGVATGLAFCTPKNYPMAPSIRNIYHEICANFFYDISSFGHSDLSSRAKQGVLLLNSILSVEIGKPLSHQNIGRQNFTDHIISTISKQKENIVFLLWGKYAMNKANLINSNKHLILTSAHPSPLSAYRGFFGNQHFYQCNKYLSQHHISYIDWHI